MRNNSGKGITKRAHVEHRKGDADRLLGMLHTCEHDKTPSIKITAIIGGEVWRRADALRCRRPQLSSATWPVSHPLPCSETAGIVVPWRGVNRRTGADRTLHTRGHHQGALRRPAEYAPHQTRAHGKRCDLLHSVSGPRAAGLVGVEYCRLQLASTNFFPLKRQPISSLLLEIRTMGERK